MSSTPPIDLFPTDALMRALEQPGSLLDDLDAAGKKAAAAFDREAGGTAEKARAFQDVLVADPDVPRSVRRRVVKDLPAWWEVMTARARDGQLSSFLAQREAESLLRRDMIEVGQPHPVLAYVNSIGLEAATSAFDAYRAALPPAALTPTPGTLLAAHDFEKATRAGNARFASAIGARVSRDLFAFFQREVPPPIFWTTIVASAAGAFGTLLFGPKLLTDAAGAVGLAVPPISADVDVGRIGDRIKLRVGGEVRVVPGALTDGPLWEQALDRAFGAGVRFGVRFDDTFALSAGVEWAPETRGWGAKLTFTLLRF